MPARNARKSYLADSYYHIYNRGVEKRQIFLDSQDYAVFLSYLKEYLLPKNETELRLQLTDPTLSRSAKAKIIRLIRMNNFYGEITFLAYCLMPNHFHFFIKQKSAQSIDIFMNSLATRYTMYFNRRHNRVGALYQAVYKASIVDSEPYFLHLSRYIHKQALRVQGQALTQQPCSYPEYIGERKTAWIHPEEILSFFSTVHPSLTYQSFVHQNDEEGLEPITCEFCEG